MMSSATFLWYFVPLFCAVLAAKIFWKLTTKWNGSYTCLIGKTAIVTGANAGLGYYTALDFAKRGARVILACRHGGRAENARRKIIDATGNTNIVCMVLDLASLQSVRQFANEFNRSEERLDILVNNAGLGFIDDEDVTADGIQFLLHVNHIGPFLLTHLLIDKLKQSTPSRIINVSSIAASRSTLTLNTLSEINIVPPITINKIIRDAKLYSTSKLCNILFTIELARRLEGTGVATNTLHPGVIVTDFFRGLPSILRVALSFIGKTFLISPEEGAQTQIYLSVSKEVQDVSGGLYVNCSRVELYKTARDPILVAKVWEKSEEFARLKGEEKINFN